MEVQIDKDIPIPANRRGRPCKYPWKELEVGDSFVFTGKTCPLHYWQIITRHRYASMLINKGDGLMKQWRIWRTA